MHSRHALLAAQDKKKLASGVTLSTYLAEIRDLVQRLNLTEASANYAFVKGLPPELQLALSLRTFRDFRALYNKAQEYLETLNPFDEDSSLGSPMTFAMAHTDAKLDRVADRLSSMDSQLQFLGNNLGPRLGNAPFGSGPTAGCGQPRPAPYYPPGEWGTGYVEAPFNDNCRCYNCRQRSHLITSCPLPRNTSEGRDQGQ